MILSYKDLKVYKKSYDLCIEMYKQTKSFPKDEQFGLISQIKRASTSIPLNIAEGYGKKSSAQEFKRFLLMALGSCNEMEVLLNISKDLGFMELDAFEKLSREYEEVAKMLNVLISKWKKY